jgi:hypothetical protein
MSKSNNIIHFDEIRIRNDLGKAEAALRFARELIAEGIVIPDGVIERIEDIIVTLEEKLIKLLEDDLGDDQ